MKQVRAEILSTRRMGAFHSLTLVAPEIAERARPGQFLAVKMPSGREFLLRRHFAIHQASRRGGWAGTLEFAFEPGGLGTEWLSTVRAHEFLDVIGPLGKGFAYPKQLTNCLLISEGHGAASVYFLAQELLARRSPWRNGWVAGSACASRASCRLRVKTGAATTTCARASTVPFSTQRACCGIGGSPTPRPCSRPRPKVYRWCIRGRGEAHALRRLERMDARDAGHDRVGVRRDGPGARGAHRGPTNRRDRQPEHHGSRTQR